MWKEAVTAQYKLLLRYLSRVRKKTKIARIVDIPAEIRNRHL
jgi:hypothetical protein